MRTQKSFLAQLLLLVTPIRFYAVDPAKEPTLVEKFNAWLKDKEALSAQVTTATARADAAEAALATAKTEAASAATAAAAALTEANGKVTAAEAKATDSADKVTALSRDVTLLEGLLASVGFKPAAGTKLDAAAFQAAFNAHVANGVTAKMAELGVKAEKLPAAIEDGGGVNSKELSYEAFSRLSPLEKMNFSAAGGKLTGVPTNWRN